MTKQSDEAKRDDTSSEDGPQVATNEPPEGASKVDVITAPKRVAYPWESTPPETTADSKKSKRK